MIKAFTNGENSDFSITDNPMIIRDNLSNKELTNCLVIEKFSDDDIHILSDLFTIPRHIIQNIAVDEALIYTLIHDEFTFFNLIEVSENKIFPVYIFKGNNFIILISNHTSDIIEDMTNFIKKHNDIHTKGILGLFSIILSKSFDNIDNYLMTINSKISSFEKRNVPYTILTTNEFIDSKNFSYKLDCYLSSLDDMIKHILNKYTYDKAKDIVEKYYELKSLITTHGFRIQNIYENFLIRYLSKNFRMNNLFVILLSIIIILVAIFIIYNK